MPELDEKIGTVGDASIGFSDGKFSVSANEALDGGAIVATEKVSMDAGVFIDQLEAIVAKAVPATAPLDPAIFAVIKSAVLAIK